MVGNHPDGVGVVSGRALTPRRSGIIVLAMLPAVERLVKDAGSELVLGLVAPVGAHLDSLSKEPPP